MPVRARGRDMASTGPHAAGLLFSSGGMRHSKERPAGLFPHWRGLATGYIQARSRSSAGSSSSSSSSSAIGLRPEHYLTWRVRSREVAAACVAPRAARRRRRRRRQQPDDTRPRAATSDMIGWHESKDTGIVVYGSGALSYMEVVLCRMWRSLWTVVYGVAPPNPHHGGGIWGATLWRPQNLEEEPAVPIRTEQHGENSKAKTTRRGEVRWRCRQPRGAARSPSDSS